MRSSSHISKYPGAVNDNNEIFGSMWHSIHPADTIETILKRHQVLINDSRIRMEVDPDYLNYPAKVSDYSPESIPVQMLVLPFTKDVILKYLRLTFCMYTL